MTQGRLHTQHRGELRLLQSLQYTRGAASEFFRCLAGLPAPPIFSLLALRCTAPSAIALSAVKGVRHSLRPPLPQAVQGRGGAGACAAAMARDRAECLQARAQTGAPLSAAGALLDAEWNVDSPDS